MNKAVAFFVEIILCSTVVSNWQWFHIYIVEQAGKSDLILVTYKWIKIFFYGKNNQPAYDSKV